MQKLSIQSPEAQRLEFAENHCILTFNSLQDFIKPKKICSETNLYAYLDDNSVQRAATANVRAVLSLSGEAHSFGRTAVQSHSQAFSDVCEALFDPEPADSTV